MNCTECQTIIGAEPDSDDPQAINHMAECAACASFHADFKVFDQKLKQAFEVDVPEGLMNFDYTEKVVEFPKARQTPKFIPYALAATVLMALGISFVSLQDSGEIGSWGQDVVAHILHEPKAFKADNALVSRNKLIQVAQSNGARIIGDFGDVTYIKSCPFRGKTVTHLVTQTEHGPVTILLLPGEAVDSVQNIAEEGYVGTVVPVDGGSIVIVGENQSSAASAEQQIKSSVQWDI